MTTVETTCGYCGKSVLKDKREFTRSTKLGRPMYCGLKCNAHARNAPKRAPEIERTCPCGQKFMTTTRVKAPVHCSSFCAHSYSYTPRTVSNEGLEAKRAAGLAHADNLSSCAEVLKRREGWKYERLREVLKNRPHEFEYELEGYVFDLVLFDIHTLVEFDGPYHAGKQLEVDAEKERFAVARGFRVERRSVQPSSIIQPETIDGL